MRLLSLLLEATDRPKAIFMAGPAGAGKSTIVKQLGLSNFQVINVDDTYEELLKKSGIGLDFKKFTPDQISQAAKLMGTARKETRTKEEEAMATRKNIILDATGAASKPLLKKKQQLEELGYDTFMLMVYVSPMVSLDRNSKRDRSLPPTAVVMNWNGVASNIDTYKQEFGNNISILNNNPTDAQTGFDVQSYIARYIKGEDKVVGKEKSPEEKAKKEAKMKQVFDNIQQLVTQEISFDDLNQTKQKITKFISQ